MLSTRVLARIAAAVFPALVAATAAAEPGITAKTIVIGQVAGFTGSVAGNVKELTEGATAYINTVNAAGGVHGRKIVLEQMDDGFDPKRSPDVARKMIEEKQVFALFLSRGTPTNDAMYPTIEQLKVPLIGPSTGAMSMYSPPRRYLFPVRPSYRSETFKIVPQLVNMGINRIAVFVTDDAFGKDVLAGIQAALKQNGLEPLIVVSQPRGSTKVDEAVAAIAKVDPQAIVMLALIDASIPFVKAMKKTGKNPVLITLSNNASNNFIKALGEDGWGVAVTQVSPSPFSRTTAIAQEYQNALKSVPGAAYSYSSIEGYISAKVLVEGLKRAGPQPTREKLIAGLESIRNLDLGGVDVTYGPDLRTGASYIDITIISKTGKFVR